MNDTYMLHIYIIYDFDTDVLFVLCMEMPTYVVYKGRVPGVYDDLENYRRQVHRFSGNSYKGYHNRAEAEGRYARYLAGEMREMRRNRMKTMGFVMMLIVTMVMLYVIVV